MGKDFMNKLERYQENVATKMTTIWTWLREAVLFVFSPSQRITWRDLWNQLLLRLCVVKSKIAVESKEKKMRLLEWVATKVPQGKPPSDFNDSWKNGIALCALMEGIVKGSCPRYDLLNPKQAESNLKLGLHLIEKHIRIKPSLNVEDFIHYDAMTERKLVCLVSQLKLASAKLRLKSAIQLPVIKLNAVTTIGAERECIAKGMGLMLAVMGRKARFHIYLKSLTVMNIVVEIRGPENTICSERITSRSPKRRRLSKIQENEEEWRKIPLEYTIQPGKITVGYTPLVIGSHRLSIIWQGQHIIGSPYTISVDDAARTVAAEPKEIKRLIVPLKRADSLEEFANKGNIRSRTGNSAPYGDVRKLGNVTRKRILRHYLIVDGTEVVIENSDTETLAKAVKNLRAQSKSRKSECDTSETSSNYKIAHCDKSADKNLANKDNKKEIIFSSKQNLDTTVETMEKFEPFNHISTCNKADKFNTSAIRVLDEISTYHILNRNEHINNANEANFQNVACTTLSRKDSLCHASKTALFHCGDETQGNNTLSPNLELSLSSNNLECASSSFCEISNKLQDSISVNSSICNLSVQNETKHTTENSEISTYKLLPGDKHKSECFPFPEDKTIPIPEDNGTQSLSSINWNIVNKENNKEDSNEKYDNLKVSSDNRDSKYFNNQSLQRLQTTPSILSQDGGNNIQKNPQNGIMVCNLTDKTINIPGNISSESINQICYQKHDILLSTYLSTTNDNTKDHCNNQGKSSVMQKSQRPHEENKIISEQINNDTTVEFSRNEIKFFPQTNQKYDPAEDKLLNTISIVEEEENTREHCAQKIFQNDVIMTLSDEEIMVLGLSTNENIDCPERGSLLFGQNKKGISIRECQEENKLEDTVQRSHQSNNTIQYIEDSINGTKQTNDKEIILIENNWKDTHNKNFLLGLADGNFKTMESPSIENHVFQNEVLNENDTLMLYDTYSTKKMSDRKSEISMNFNTFTSPEFQNDRNAVIDTVIIGTKTQLLIDKQIKSSTDTLHFNQDQFERELKILNSFNSDINMKETSNELAGYSQELDVNPEQNTCILETMFDKFNNPISNSNVTSITYDQSLENAIESSNFPHNINQDQTISNQNLADFMFCDDNSVDVTVCNYEQKKTHGRSTLEKQKNNFDNTKIQNETVINTRNSEECPENIATHNRSNVLEELVDTFGTSPQKKLCCCPQKEQPILLELPVPIIQHRSNNTSEQTSEIQECGKCLFDDEEEEFPFAAIVQVKKEYWEKKLEETSKQTSKVYSVRKSGDNVGKLKSFWQDVAKDA